MGQAHSWFDFARADVFMGLKYMRTLFQLRGLFASVLLVLLFHPAPLPAQEFEAEGTIQEHIIQPGQPDSTTSAAFKVYVRDCAWLIETAETNSSGTIKQRRVGSMNGTEIYQITSYPKAGPSVSAANPAGVGRPGILGADSGQVVSNSFPVGSMNDSIIPHLWVMFASQCYFKSQNPTNRLMPVYDVDSALADTADLRLEADWELMKGGISLPLKMVYYNNGGFYHMSTNRVVKFQNYGPPYNGGFTDAVYAVTATTNFGGTPFPAGFTFKEFSPGGGPTRDQLQARKTAEAVVTAFRPIYSRKDLLPEIENVTQVQDLRLARAAPKVASFTYVLTKGANWLPLPEARQRVQVYPRQINNTPVSNGVLITLLLLPSLVVVCFMLKSKSTATALGYGAVPFLLYSLLFADSPWGWSSGFFSFTTVRVTAIFRNPGTQWMVVLCLACDFFLLLFLERRAGFPAFVAADASRCDSPGTAGRWRRIYARCRVWFATPDFWLAAMVLLALARYALENTPTFRPPKIPVFIAGIFSGKAISLWVRWRGEHVGRRIAWLVGLLICCFVCGALWQQPAPMRLKYHGILRWTGPWENPNLFGLLMGTGIVLAAAKILQAQRWKVGAGKWKKMICAIPFILVALLCGYSLFKSYSRGAWIGTTLGLGYLAWQEVQGRWFSWFKNNRLSIAIILASCLLLGFWQGRFLEWRPVQRMVSVGNINDFSWRNRVVAWEGATRMMVDRPLAGFGWQEAESAYAKNYLPPQLSESAAIQMNDYFMLGISAGVPALFCFLAYLWLSLARKPRVGSQVSESAAFDSGLPAAPERSNGGWTLAWPAMAGRAGVIVLLIGFWFDGGFFRLPAGPVFWILMGLVRLEPEFRNRPVGSCDAPSQKVAGDALVASGGSDYATASENATGASLPPGDEASPPLSAGHSSVRVESPAKDGVMGPSLETNNPKPEIENKPETPGVISSPKKEFRLQRLAWVLATAALVQTTVYLGTPFLPVSDGTLAVARKCLIPPGEIGDFDFLSADPVWQGRKLKILLEHAELANYNRRIVNWKLDDSIYREYVLPPAIQPERDGQYHWRRALWEYFYPRNRKTAALESAAQNVRQQLQKRQKMVGKGPATIEEMWQQQTADKEGLEALCVAAWRSIGIPARLNASGRAEFFNDGKWQ